MHPEAKKLPENCAFKEKAAKDYTTCFHCGMNVRKYSPVFIARQRATNAEKAAGISKEAIVIHKTCFETYYKADYIAPDTQDTDDDFDEKYPDREEKQEQKPVEKPHVNTNFPPVNPAVLPPVADKNLIAILHKLITAYAYDPNSVNADTTNALNLIAKGTAPILEKILKIKADTPDKASLTDFIERELEKMFDKKAILTIRIKTEHGEVILPGLNHRLTGYLIKLSQTKKGDGARFNVYLYGKPGGGKSTACAAVARYMKTEYYYEQLTKVSAKSDIFGFKNVEGIYIPTKFRMAWEFGGVILFDELDNSSPSLVVALNNMLDSMLGSFPDKMVPRHPNFFCCAAGNTPGFGPSPLFPERTAFDSATRERFKFVAWDYDELLERQLTIGQNPHAEDWLLWVRKVREFCFKNAIRIFASPRVSIEGAIMLREGFSIDDMLEAVLWQGNGAENPTVLNRIFSNCGHPTYDPPVEIVEEIPEFAETVEGNNADDNEYSEGDAEEINQELNDDLGGDTLENTLPSPANDLTPEEEKILNELAAKDA